MKRTINQLFLYIKLDNCFANKTGRIVLVFSNADDFSKVFTGWKSNFPVKSTKAFYDESSNKRRHGIITDVPIDFSYHVNEKELENGTEFERYQRSSRPLPVVELLFKSEAEYDIAINNGIYIAKMHFKMEAKIEKIKLFHFFNCQKQVIHISKLRKFEPDFAICGYDHPSKSHKNYVCQIPMTTATNVYHLIECTAYIVMVTTLHLTKDAKFSNKLTLELLQIPMDELTSTVALLLINIAGFPLHSGFSLDCYIID